MTHDSHHAIAKKQEDDVVHSRRPVGIDRLLTEHKLSETLRQEHNTINLNIGDPALFNPLQILKQRMTENEDRQEYRDRGRRQSENSRDRSRSPRRSVTIKMEHDPFVSRVSSFVPALSLSRVGGTPDTEKDLVTTSTSRLHPPSTHADARDVTPDMCTCPTDVACFHRTKRRLLDCRLLVPESQPFHDSHDEESYIRQTLNSSASQFPIATTQEIGYIIDLIDRVESLSHKSALLKGFYLKMREWAVELHNCHVEQSSLDATRVIQRLKCFLAPDNSESRRVRKFSHLLEQELTCLTRKWARGDLSCDPNRGLIVHKRFDKNGILLSTRMLLDKEWMFYQSAKYYGEGVLVIGQTWLTRLQMMRDGAHAVLQGGISGTPETGAMSVVVGSGIHSKGHGYANIDKGNIIEYVGTALPADAGDEDTNTPDADMNTREFDMSISPTFATQALMKSYETKNPVRVIRSPTISDQITHKPFKCYRYDGLYRVVDMIPLREKRQIWSFTLERLPNQGPLRGLINYTAGRSARTAREGWVWFDARKYGGPKVCKKRLLVRRGGNR